MKLVGKRTYVGIIVIISLAFCQRFLGIVIPQEVWLVLFGLVIASLRAAVEAKK